MPTEHRREANPFQSPVKTPSSAPPTKSDTNPQQPDILATADLLLEQVKELENLCSTVEERVQRKRRALKELAYLISGPNSADGSPYSPACPTNTPIGSRSHLVPPRLRGLFDLRGPGQANLNAIQSCLDYSPDAHTIDNISTWEDPGHSGDWMDDEEEPLISPFDDKYALLQSLKKVEKELPAIPRKEAGDMLGSKIPRKTPVLRQVSTSRRLTDRPSSGVKRNTSNRRRPSVREVKAVFQDSQPKGRRGSWKRCIMENVRTRGGAKITSAIENETEKECVRRKERRKGLRSIYSVCSELGLNGATSFRAQAV